MPEENVFLNGFAALQWWNGEIRLVWGRESHSADVLGDKEGEKKYHKEMKKQMEREVSIIKKSVL